jgi:hypothetical protein
MERGGVPMKPRLVNWRAARRRENLFTKGISRLHRRTIWKHGMALR